MAGLKPWTEAPCQAFPLPRTFGKGAWGSLLHSNAPPYIWDLPVAAHSIGVSVTELVSNY